MKRFFSILLLIANAVTFMIGFEFLFGEDRDEHEI